MASPDDPDATADAGAVPAAHPPLSGERVELPVYRPRRRIAVHFWLAFAIGAVAVAIVVWVVLA